MIMKLKIEIVMDNAAFDPAPSVEVGRILHALADEAAIGHMFDEIGDRMAIMDSNGNRVGEAKVTR